MRALLLVACAVLGTCQLACSRGATSSLSRPFAVALDSSGNIYVANAGDYTVRTVTPAGVGSVLAGTPGEGGSVDGIGTAALFNFPCGVAVDGSGNVYVADFDNHTIRKIAPGGVVSTFAGMAGQAGSTDGMGAAARFYRPAGVAVDRSGNVYVADAGNGTIRTISPLGVVSTLAGTAGQIGSADGTGGAAQFDWPSSVAVDGSGNVYVADYENDVIRKVTSSGVVSTIAGTAGQPGSADGTGAAAQFHSPSGVAVDASGNVYVADSFNNTIRMITPAAVVSTLAGTPGQSGSSDGTGAAALFYGPFGVAVDGSGDVLVADTFNNAIRKVLPSGVVSTLTVSGG